MDIYGGSCADIPIVNRILHQPRNLEGPTLYLIFIRGSLMPQQDFGWRTHQSINYSWFTQEFPGTKYWGYWCRKKHYICWWNTVCLPHYIPLHTITYHYITCMPYIRVEANGRQWCRYRRLPGECFAPFPVVPIAGTPKWCHRCHPMARGTRGGKK
jgi:hypothetical protein